MKLVLVSGASSNASLESKVKKVLIVFFDIRGLAHHEFVPHGTTLNAKFYVEVLKRLK